MIKIGDYNNLEVIDETPFGLRLNAGKGEDVLLPKRYVEPEMTLGDTVRVFVYTDSEDRIIAVTDEPYATAGEFAWLMVKEVTDIGAFMDIGLPKDLLVPFSNQDKRMQENKSYLVYVYVDEVTERMVGSVKVHKFVDKDPSDLNPGDEVDLLVGEPTDLGYYVIVNQKYQGLLYKNEIFKTIAPGEKHVGYVKQVRPEDGKIDATLEKSGYKKVEPGVEMILDALKNNQGFLPLTDKSSPEEINRMFPISKKTFKKAVGSLYKDRKIELKDDGIYLIDAGK